MERRAAHRSLKQTLIDALASRISSGEIPDGVGINETMLAQMFSVSRTPARLALVELENRGLICPAPTRGYVTGSSPQAAKGRLTDLAEKIDIPNTIFSKKTTGLTAFNELERQVIRLSVHGMWRLSVRAVREHLSVSGALLLDMLAEMQASGLLIHRPGGQWIVPRIDTVRIEMLYDVRSWLEPKLIEQATVNIPITVLNSVQEAHEKALARLSSTSAAELDALEEMLHHDLLVYAGNEPGLAALKTLKAGLIMSKHVLATGEVPTGSNDPFIDEHIAVIGAMQRRRPEECKLRLQAHLLKSREKVTERLHQFRQKSRVLNCDSATLIE